MTESTAKIPGGIRYYFGREARLRRAVEATAMSVFSGWAYEEITTPAVDYYSLFESGMGVGEAQRAFKLTDSDGQLLALRPDVTSAVARAAATLLRYRARPLRFCYAAPVFRFALESKSEWKREATQIGAELIGLNSMVADMEALLIARELLTRLGLGKAYTITLNDLEIFNGVANSLGLNAAEREEMRTLIDTRNGSDLRAFLIKRCSIEEAEAFVELVLLSGKAEVFAHARQVITNTRSLEALNRLEALWQIIETLKISEQFEVDFGDLSRLDYYTGLVFKIYIKGAGSRAGSGGRYDQLTACFGKAEPAIGFVLDLDILVGALMNAESLSDDQPLADSTRLISDDPTLLLQTALQKREAGQRIIIGREEQP